MMTNQAIRRAMTRTFGIAAAATMMLSLATAAQALSLSNPGMAPATKQMRDAVTTQVRHGAGGFRSAGHAFHGGRFRAAAPAFHGNGFRHRPAFVGGGFRHGGPAFARRGFYAPAYYGHRRHFHRHRYFRPRYYGYVPRYDYGPRHFCRVIWTYHGPRKICRYRPWFHRHWHHRRHFNVYW